MRKQDEKTHKQFTVVYLMIGLGMSPKVPTIIRYMAVNGSAVIRISIIKTRAREKESNHEQD